jgi:hypothetical protein
VPKSSSEIRTPSACSCDSTSWVELGVAQQRGFGDLDFEPVRRQAGDLERVANLAQHVALVELLRREVDGDADGVRPLHAFHAGLAQDPAAEIDDQAHILGDRNESIGDTVPRTG